MILKKTFNKPRKLQKNRGFTPSPENGIMSCFFSKMQSTSVVKFIETVLAEKSLKIRSIPAKMTGRPRIGFEQGGHFCRKTTLFSRLCSALVEMNFATLVKSMTADIIKFLARGIIKKRRKKNNAVFGTGFTPLSQLRMLNPLLWSKLAPVFHYDSADKTKFSKDSTKRIRSCSTGFTLLEILVALAVFSVAITFALSGLLSITASQKKAVALQNVYDNTRFAFEAMTKEIRTGIFYHCSDIIDESPPSIEPQDCVAGGRSLTFENSEGEMITYQFKEGRIQKRVSGSDFLNITAIDVSIERLLFYVVGSGESDDMQARVTAILSASAGSETRANSQINLQTTVTQRNPEF